MKFDQVEGVTFAGDELISLYRFLKAREAELDYPTDRLLERIERRLYEGLSIEEMERLEEEIRNN